MIFIITHKNDYTVDFVIDKLNQRNIEYYRFNCEDIDKYGYSFRLGESENISIHNIQNVDSVWFRRTKLPEVRSGSSSEKLFVLNDYDSLLSNIYHLIDSKKWMSNPRDVYEAENKLFQLRLAKKLNLKTPNTLISSNPKEIVLFAKEYNNKIIIKPITQGRISDSNGVRNIFTNVVREDHLERLEEFDMTPSVFQEYIEKDYELRVTVVGTKVFSAKVDSQRSESTKIDWRKEKSTFTKYDLPKEVSKKCVELLKHMNLNFGAIDIIKTTNGEYLFLEINPNGQWAWIEFDTGLPIADAIINFLMN